MNNFVLKKKTAQHSEFFSPKTDISKISASNLRKNVNIENWIDNILIFIISFYPTGGRLAPSIGEMFLKKSIFLILTYIHCSPDGQNCTALSALLQNSHVPLSQ